MREKFEEAASQENYENRAVKDLAEGYDNEQIPLKIRKIKLLEAANLPISDTTILSIDNTQEIRKKIAERIDGGDAPLIMRFSGRADKLGMPSFYIDDKDNLDSSIKQMEEILGHDPDIAYIVLQSATPKEEMPNKISGRLMVYEDANDKYDAIVELYKGARSTGILNSVDPSDPQFHRLIKPIGGFMRPEKEIDPNSTLNTGEVLDIVRTLGEKDNAIKTIQSVLHESKKHNRNEYVLEFSYRNGDLVFTDID